MKTTRKLATLAATLTTFGSLAGGANAAITFESIGSNQYRANFDPITFNVTTNTSAFYISFEDFFTTSSGSFGSAISGDFSYSLNGASSVTVNHTSSSGTVSFSPGGITDANDLYFNFSGGPLVDIGDTISISGNNLVFSTASIGGIPNSGTFNATLANSAFTAISNDVAVSLVSVPEPSSTLLLGLGALGFVFRRKRTA